MISHADVVAQRATLEDVVPGGDVERRNLDVLEVFFDGPLLPVAVVVGVGGPIDEVGREGAREVCTASRGVDIEDGVLREGQHVAADEGVGIVTDRAIERVLREAGAPRLVEPLFECAALVGPVFVIVAGGDDGADAGEMRGMADGGEHLRGAYVGSAPHADFAVGGWQRGGPFDGVETVFSFVLEGIPLALGGIAAADILNDDEVSACGGAAAEFSTVVLVVGGALKERGELAFADGVIDVCPEGYAIAGLHGDAALDGDVSGLCGCECGSGKND